MNNALNQMLNEIQQIRANNDTGEFGPVSPQEKKYLAAFQNNPSAYFQGLRAVDDELAMMKANNPNVSNQEMQMFKAMSNGAGNRFTSPIEEMRALQQKGASGAGFLSDVEINRFMQLRNQLNPNLPQEKPLATVLEPVDIDGAGQMSLQELTRFLQNSERLGRSGY